jgi:adenylate cyclase
MHTITRYEVYEASSGQWTLTTRFGDGERETALAHARTIEQQHHRPVAVIEEVDALASSQPEVRLIHKTFVGAVSIRPPSTQNDIPSRMIMVVLTALALGAVVATIAATVASNGPAGSGPLFKVLMGGAFLSGAVVGGASLFRIYIPVGLVHWNAKNAESRRRTIQALVQGIVVAPTPTDDANAMPRVTTLDPIPAVPDLGEPPALQETQPSMEPAMPPSAPEVPPAPHAAPVTTTPPPETTPDPSDAASVATSMLAGVVSRLAIQMEPFIARIMTEAASIRPMMTPQDRQAMNLYVAGAVQGMAERNVLDAEATLALLYLVLPKSGLPETEVDSVLAEIQAEAERPRFRRVIENGAAALNARIENPNATLSPTLAEVFAGWTEQAGQAGAQLTTLLLTDIVGSTALTSQIGNAGAQRVVRAHNTIVRAAAKAFKGREVKHTGDGMLLVFPNAAAGGRAAMDIQREATAYAQDNPAAPLALRVGLHIGEAVEEDGEYYGAAMSVVNGLAGVGETGYIACSGAIKQRIADSTFQFQDLGPQALKGSATPVEVHRLLWEPKRPTGPGVLEYRQLGTAPSPPAADAGSAPS